MKRVIRFKASGQRVFKRKCAPGQIVKNGSCTVQTASDALRRKRSAKKMVKTKNRQQAKTSLGIRAMKRAVAKRHAAGY
jgi:hypothetical protein